MDRLIPDREQALPLISAEAERLGAALAPEQAAALYTYLELICRWNPRIRLFGSREPDAIVRLHLADGLAAAAHLPDSGTLIDVGSGGGVPGIPIAILRPRLTTTLCEKVGKKADFLRAVRRAIDRPFEIAETSVETVDGRFDHAISRATFAAEDWWTIGSRLVQPEGRVWAMLSRAQADELLLENNALRWNYFLESRPRVILSLPIVTPKPFTG